ITAGEGAELRTIVERLQHLARVLSLRRVGIHLQEAVERCLRRTVLGAVPGIGRLQRRQLVVCFLCMPTTGHGTEVLLVALRGVCLLSCRPSLIVLQRCNLLLGLSGMLIIRMLAEKVLIGSERIGLAGLIPIRLG